MDQKFLCDQFLLFLLLFDHAQGSVVEVLGTVIGTGAGLLVGLADLTEGGACRETKDFVGVPRVAIIIKYHIEVALRAVAGAVEANGARGGGSRWPAATGCGGRGRPTATATGCRGRGRPTATATATTTATATDSSCGGASDTRESHRLAFGRNWGWRGGWHGGRSRVRV